MNTDLHRYYQETGAIIGCSYIVANILGRGFVEKVYANALAYELIQKNFKIKKQHPIKVYYKGSVVGILIETKACSGLNNLHISQCLNYLKACNLHLCLLINFGTPLVQLRRVIN